MYGSSKSWRTGRPKDKSGIGGTVWNILMKWWKK